MSNILYRKCTLAFRFELISLFTVNVFNNLNVFKMTSTQWCYGQAVRCQIYNLNHEAALYQQSMGTRML